MNFVRGVEVYTLAWVLGFFGGFGENIDGMFYF